MGEGSGGKGGGKWVKGGREVGEKGEGSGGKGEGSGGMPTPLSTSKSVHILFVAVAKCVAYTTCIKDSYKRCLLHRI